MVVSKKTSAKTNKKSENIKNQERIIELLEMQVKGQKALIKVINDNTYATRLTYKYGNR
jgi:hypothetical protein